MMPIHTMDAIGDIVKSEVPVIGRRVDLNLVVVFDAIYRARNLTAAGRYLALSQPAMSHALGRLRHAFKDPLFVRLPGGLVPTPFAEEIAPALAQALAAIRASFERSGFDPSRSTRIFGIVMSDIGEVVLLPAIAREVAREAPRVQLRTFDMADRELRDALSSGAVDLAVRANFEPGGGLRRAALYDIRYLSVVRADHPILRSRSSEDFGRARHLLVKPKGRTMGHGEVVQRALTARGVKATIGVQVENFHGVAALLAESDLVATIPAGLAMSLSRIAGVRTFEPPIALPTIKNSLFWHERYQLDAGNAWLRKIVLRLFKTPRSER